MLGSLYHVLGAVLAFYYDDVLSNFAGAIALLTLTVMVVTAPFAIRSTRWALAMQRLHPEMQQLRVRYRSDPARLNDETMKLYKARGVHPAGGCVAALIPLPLFFVLYHVIEGLSATALLRGRVFARPENIPHGTKLYRALVAGGGHVHALGIDLARSALAVHSPVGLAYWGVVGLVVLVQYVQSRQVRSRSGSQSAPGAVGAAQQILPWTFAVVSAVVSAGVNIYFLVSGLCRIVQSAVAVREGPVLRRADGDSG